MAKALQQLGSNGRWLYLLGGIFIAVNALLISQEFYYASIVPLALVVLMLAFFALDKLVLLIVFLTPMSVNMTDIGLGVGLTIPTDPLLFGVLVIFLLKLIAEHRFSKKVADHPITLAIVINLVWMGITCITSEMPIVSVKFFISRLWYVVAFYMVATQIFKDFNKVKWFLGLYIAGFVFIIIYTIVHHSMYGFLEQSAHWVMSPFFNDHTSYGAALAMFYPLLVGLVFSKLYSRSWRLVFIALLGLFTAALLLSYTRAAWVSLIGALGVFLILKWRIRFSTVLLFAGVAALGLIFSWSSIVMKLEKNRQDSSAAFTEHVQSILNISTDASNLERLNRWGSAWRMFKERPFVGWGPGTYMFQYAPFQLSSEKTSISTNAGDKGNAHSEYIGPLAESGVFGMLSFIMIVVCVLYYGIRLYGKDLTKEHRLIMTSLFLGLITYLIHGAMNNFLDTDKASAPFWGFIAVMVAIDVFHSDKRQQASKELSESDG